MTRIYLALAFTTALVHAGCSADNRIANSAPPDSPTNASALKPGMKIRLKIEDKVLTAKLVDSKTTRDFVSFLPLTLTMNDLFRREKFAHLPRAISEEGKRTHSYEVGRWFIGRRVLTWRSSIEMMARRFLTPALSSSAK